MKYAVLYLSNTGNTEMIAVEIYNAIDTDTKVLVNVKGNKNIPDADFYFVGFPVYNKSCSLDAMDLLDKINNSRLAIFATSGLIPTDKYKDRVEHNISIWINETSEFFGMFMCQGKTEHQRQNTFIEQNPNSRELLNKIFKEGSYHPNVHDLELAKQFTRSICAEIE